MPDARWCLALLVGIIALLPLTVRATAAAPRTRTVVLYDGSLQPGTPDTQGFSYLARPKTGPLLARQSFADGVTTLTTTLQTGDSAGYFARTERLPPLDRAAGYSVRFTVQLTAEDHAGSDKNGDGISDRAGFSIIALSSDTRGIELGFWGNEVWAQADGASEPPPNSNTLFTHAEGATFDTMARLTTYELHIMGDAYTLSSGELAILSGPLRDYRAFGQFPYIVPNFLFLGDDTTSASATIRLANVAVIVPGDAPTAVPSATATPTATATPCPPPTQAALEVEPVDSPTHARSQLIKVRLANGDWVSVTGPAGTVREDGFDTFEIDLPLASGRHNPLVVRGKVRLMPGGCGYGGYELTTLNDSFGKPLDILQLAPVYLPVVANRRGPPLLATGGG